MKLKGFESQQYLQVCSRFWKFGYNFVKFIAYGSAFHSHIRLFDQACTVPCFWAQNFGLQAAAFIISLLLSWELGGRGNSKSQKGEDIEVVKHDLA